MTSHAASHLSTCLVPPFKLNSKEKDVKENEKMGKSKMTISLNLNAVLDSLFEKRGRRVTALGLSAFPRLRRFGFRVES